MANKDFYQQISHSQNADHILSNNSDQHLQYLDQCKKQTSSPPHMDSQLATQLQKYRYQQNIQETNMIIRGYIFVSFLQAKILVLYPLYLTQSTEDHKKLVLMLLQTLISLIFYLFVLLRKYEPKQMPINTKYLLVCCCGSQMCGIISAYVGFLGILILIHILSTVLLYYVIWYKRQSDKQQDNKFFDALVSSISSLLLGQIGYTLFCSQLETKKDKQIIIGYISTIIFGCGIIATIGLVISQISRYKYKQKISIFTYFLFVFICYFFMYGLSFSISIIYNSPYLWVICSQIPNTLFLIQTYLFIKQILTNTSKLYPISRSLLTFNQNHHNRIRNNIILDSCTVCLSQQSRFYYKQCMHVCCGYNCIVSWLKSANSQCPLCRNKSDLIVQIKRAQYGVFQIVMMYKINNIN